MNNETNIIKRDNDSGTIDDMTINGLESNCWIIDKKIKYVNPFNGYNSIIADLNHSKECVLEIKRKKEKEINDKVEQLIIRALFTNSIISYARCFNSTKKEGRISLDFNVSKKYFPTETNIGFNELYSFHKYILKLRNKFIAHADKNDYETEKAYIEFKYDGEYLDYNFNSYEIKMNNFDEIQMENFLILIETLLTITNVKKNILLEKINDEIGNDKLVRIGMKIAKITKVNTS